MNDSAPSSSTRSENQFESVNAAMAVYVGPSPVDAERRALKRRMTAEVRRLVTASALLDVADADPADLRRAVDDTARLAHAIGAMPSLGGLCAPRSGSAEDSALFERSPLCGRSNPLAPDMRLHRTASGVSGHVTYDAAYEGPAGCAHGGWVIAVFDDLLAFAMSTGGTLAPTGTLSVRLTAPTPLHARITLEAGITGTEGRKTTCWGRSWAGSVPLATATAVFIGPANPS